MKKYIFDDKKEEEIFLSVEKVLNKNIFPEMTKIENDEINFLKRNLKKEDNFLEVGCGGGRVLNKIENNAKISGSEINKLFIKSCQNRNLNVFYLNALKKVPKERQEKYDFILLAYNLFYNFSKENRLKIINHCYSLLKNNGRLTFTFFDLNKITSKIQKEMMDYYKKVINAPQNLEIIFLEKREEKGICLKKQKNVLWSSLWKTNKGVIKESKEWKKFDLEKIEKGKDSIANFVVLKKC